MRNGKWQGLDKTISTSSSSVNFINSRLPEAVNRIEKLTPAPTFTMCSFSPPGHGPRINVKLATSEHGASPHFLHYIRI